MNGTTKSALTFFFLLGVVFASGVSAPRVFADTPEWGLTPTGPNTVDFVQSDRPYTDFPGHSHSYWVGYKGVYPDRSIQCIETSWNVDFPHAIDESVFIENPAGIFGDVNSAPCVGNGDYWMSWQSTTSPDAIYEIYHTTFERIAENDWSVGARAFNLQTRFITFTPQMGTSTPNATSTNFAFGATVYVNPADYVASSTELYIRWRQLTGMGLRGNPVVGLTGECTVAIENFGSTTPDFCFDDIQASGAYLAYYEIRVPSFSLFGVNFFNRTLVSTTGNFVVGFDVSNGEYLRSATAISTTGPTVDAIVDPDAVATSTGFFLSFFDVPGLLQKKIPFAYFYQMVSIFQTYPTIPASTNSTLVLNFVATSSPLSATLNGVEMFSTTTVTQLLPSPVIDLLYGLQVAVIWLSVGFLMYRWSMNIIAKQ